jgi:hypothetical protein
MTGTGERSWYVAILIEASDPAGPQTPNTRGYDSGSPSIGGLGGELALCYA